MSREIDRTRAVRQGGGKMKLATRPGLAAFHADCAGVLEAIVVRRPAALGLLAQAAAGSSKMRRCILALAEWFDGVGRARPLCLNVSCPTQFGATTTPGAFVICFPPRDDPRDALVCGVCAPCAAARDDDAMRLLLRQLWPEMRILDAPHGAGSA